MKIDPKSSLVQRGHRNRKPLSLLVAAGSALATSHAATIEQTANADSSTDWNDAVLWGGAAPTAGNDYVTTGPGTDGSNLNYEVGNRVRILGTQPDFAGDSLTVIANTEILIKATTGTYTANLILDGGLIRLAPNSGAANVVLDGALSLPQDSVIGVNHSSASSIDIAAPVTGASTLRIRAGQRTTHIIRFSGDLSGFTGTLEVGGGTQPITLDFDQDYTLAGDLVVGAGETFDVVNLDQTITVPTLTVAGVGVEAGTYTAEQLNALVGDGTQFVEAGGSITVLQGPSDSDNDGMSDEWEILYFGDIGFTDDSGADLDTDDGSTTGTVVGDSFSNAEEEAAGSDPLNPLSVPGDIDGDGLADLWEDANFGDANGIPTSVELALQDGSGDPDQDYGSNEDEETAGTDPNSRADFLDEDDGTPDGLNDWWELAFFGDTTTATATTGDPDADGADNQTEYDAFSDPVDPSSLPGDIDGDLLDDLWEDQYFGNNDGIVTLEDVAVTDDTEADLDADGFTNKQEADADPVPSNPNDVNSVPNDADNDGLADDWEIDFFGAIDTPDNLSGLQDPDNDLYTNEEEETIGTDPLDPFDFNDENDSDDDNQNDRWEILYFGDLTTSESDEDDSDGDNFFNYEEFEFGSDPTNAQSTPDDNDGDGLLDAEEVISFGDIYSYDGEDDPDRDYSTNLEEQAALTNPNDRAAWPDSDGDGLGDGWEIFSFGTIDPNEGGTDDPGVRDTEDPTIIISGDPDNDGFTNGEELAAASNGNDPLSTPDSDGDGLPEGYEVSFWGDATTQTGDDDSDSDGASNRLEFLTGTNPTDPGETPNPALLQASADTYLSNDTQNASTGPAVAHGGETLFELRVFDGTRIRVPVIRFDVASLEGDFSNTMLRLNVTDSPRTRDLLVYGLVDGDPGETWDETTTTYLTAPGIIPAESERIGTFARNPQTLRLLGTFPIGDSDEGNMILSDPALLDLASFLSEDQDGLVTLYLGVASENQTWRFTSNEGAASAGNPQLAPTLVAPNAAIEAPSSLAVDGVEYDDTAATLSLSIRGLEPGSTYQLEASPTGMLGPFSPVGAAITASASTEVLVIENIDTANEPTKFFRISDDPEP